jgi:tetraacyldisaccharide 4'-kinase
MRLVERIWNDSGGALGLVRAALAPLGAAYAAAMGARRRLYGSGVFTSYTPELPVLSVGNLTVGGTGKTPVSAWVASRLRERAHPAILLRGYGKDEVDVHALLNPGVPVVANADRVAGVRAAKRTGADVVVADDAFQHRRLRRVADMLLLSVEQLQRPQRVLPAGPWRESLAAAAAADLLVYTRKSASAEDARRVAAMVGATIPVPYAIVHLAAGSLVDARTRESRPIASLRGREVLAVAAIGEPELFRIQLEQLGARVQLMTFRDHHEFTADDASRIAARAPAGGLVVCTLKDAVKLAPLWPVSSPLWYVSQQLVVDEGAEHLNQLLDRVLNARDGTTITAG